MAGVCCTHLPRHGYNLHLVLMNVMYSQDFTFMAQYFLCVGIQEVFWA